MCVSPVKRRDGGAADRIHIEYIAVEEYSRTFWRDGGHDSVPKYPGVALASITAIADTHVDLYVCLYVCVYLCAYVCIYMCIESCG